MNARNEPAALESVAEQNNYQDAATWSLVCATILGLTFPGALASALALAGLFRVTRPPLAARCWVAALGLLTAAASSAVLSLAWPARLLVAVVSSTPTTLQPAALTRSALFKTAFGPALLLLLQLAQWCRSRTALGQIERERELAVKRSEAMKKGWGDSSDREARAAMAPPVAAGKIRLGTDDTQVPFDIVIDDLALHVFVPGATGTGKTTTLVRLATGALENGWGVVIVDCKGIGLGADAKKLAETHSVPYTIVDPDDEATVGYDACTGDAAHVSNKIIGAFTFSGNAEIYKQIAMQVVPVIVRALQASGAEVTLDAISDSLQKGGLARLGRAPGAEAFRERLQALEESAGNLGQAGYAGVRFRLGALTQGKFGEVLSRRPALDWHETTSRAGVTYLSLSATAASEDVELIGRVITQDLKQLCATRLRAINAGEDIVPMLVVYDEFAALREPEQIVDLLLQARQARMALVVATQFIPEEVPIRTPLLQAGLLLCHRVAAADAEAIAAELGTKTALKPTSQVDYETGISEKGSIRDVEEYNVHPNVLRKLGVGLAVVYSRPTDRRALVHIQRDT